MSLTLPNSTRVNRFVAKTNFYKLSGMTPKLRTLMEQQVEKITWSHKLAPTTMNISSGEIPEFQFFDIELKSADIDSALLFFIQKSVPYPLLFTIRGGRGIKAAAVIKEAKHQSIVSTDWLPDVSLKIIGTTTDGIYKNFLYQLSPTFAAVAGDTEKHIEAKRIERTIDALTVKIRQETQINKRQSMARERHELETKLKELLS